MLAGKHGLKILSVACTAIALWGASSCQLSRTITSSEPQDSTRKGDSAKGPIFQRVVDKQKETIHGTYEVTGNRLVAQFLPRDSVMESRYCLYSSTGKRDSLFTSHDTLIAFDSLAWSIRQDSLVLSLWQDTSYTSLDSIPYLTEWIYSRVSGSNQSALDGTFRMVGMRDRPLRPLPAGSGDSSSILQVWNQTKLQFSQFQEILVTFQGGRISSSNRSIPSWADLILLQWTGGLPGATAESTWYEIDMRKLDDTTVTETGRKTKEIVTRKQVRPEPSMLYLSDVSFTSSDSSHHGGVSHFNPATCPDGVEWFSDFRRANRKSYTLAREARMANPATIPSPSRMPALGRLTIPRPLL